MIHKIICFLLCSGLCSSVFAQSHSSEIGIQSDNDSYLAQGSDRYYTDGIFIYYRHVLSVNGNTNLQNKVLGFETGQKIFNPQTGKSKLNLRIRRQKDLFIQFGGNISTRPISVGFVSAQYNYLGKTPMPGCGILKNQIIKF